ncbi:MAG: hypothetical protein V4697_02565 [Patescibacteria group bacterium]
MEILPAILPKDFAEIEEKIELVRGLSKRVQVDVCDGKFVPSSTWPYKKHDENFEAILHEEKGMPSWEVIDYEFDLMIHEPTEDDARKWLSAGATRIVLHIESSKNLHPALDVLSGLVDIGLALNISTPLESIAEYKDKISYVQLMGIDKVGFQGQRFNPSVVDRVKKVKEMYPDLLVQIDGGVSLENASLLKHAGVDRLVVGSGLFGTHAEFEDAAGDVVDTYAQFKAI